MSFSFDESCLVYQFNIMLADIICSLLQTHFQEDWSLFQITKRRTTKLKMTEYSETFSGDHAEGTEVFNLSIMVGGN